MTFPLDLGQVYTTPNTTDKLNNPSHSERHQNEAIEIQALKEKVGIDSSADADSLDYHKNNTSNPHSVTKTQVGLENIDNTSDATKLAATLLAVYPIGAIYTSVVSTSPATLFGGTWSAFGEGKVLVGINSADTDFDTVEETGGVKTVTLTGEQSGMPQHYHGYKYGSSAGGDGTGVAYSSTTGTQVNEVAILHTDAVNAAEAHTNLQPYIVVYMWKRTA